MSERDNKAVALRGEGVRMGSKRKDVRASLRAVLARPDCMVDTLDHYVLLSWPNRRWRENTGMASELLRRADAALRAVGAKTRIGGAS